MLDANFKREREKRKENEANNIKCERAPEKTLSFQCLSRLWRETHVLTLPRQRAASKVRDREAGRGGHAVHRVHRLHSNRSRRLQRQLMRSPLRSTNVVLRRASNQGAMSAKGFWRCAPKHPLKKKKKKKRKEKRKDRLRSNDIQFIQSKVNQKHKLIMSRKKDCNHICYITC